MKPYLVLVTNADEDAGLEEGFQGDASRGVYFISASEEHDKTNSGNRPSLLHSILIAIPFVYHLFGSFNGIDRLVIDICLWLFLLNMLPVTSSNADMTVIALYGWQLISILIDLQQHAAVDAVYITVLVLASTVFYVYGYGKMYSSAANTRKQRLVLGLNNKIFEFLVSLIGIGADAEAAVNSAKACAQRGRITQPAVTNSQPAITNTQPAACAQRGRIARVLASYLTLRFPSVVQRQNIWLQHEDAAAPLALDLNSIRDYYGSKISFFFAYLHFYSHWLLIPASLSAVVLLVPQMQLQAVYPLAVCIWSTVFLSSWKRQQKDLARQWPYQDTDLSTTRGCSKTSQSSCRLVIASFLLAAALALLVYFLG